MHRVFRAAFGSSVEYVEGCDPADVDRVEVVGTYFDNVLRLLHVHHAGEDELMTPRLVDRGSDDEIEDVTRVAAQHLDIVDAIETAEEAVATWRTQPDADSAAVASDALSSLAGPLANHLDEEELTILPIAARHLTQPEWAELPSHGMQNFSGDKMWLVIGLIREQMSDEQRGRMAAAMPPPVAQWWAEQGESTYTAFIERLRA
jgi:hypothetical protein